MAEYRLIAVDVDGTLLNSTGQITSRTREALLRATSRGVRLAVATGRRRRTALPILEQLAVPHFLVSSQGAAVWDDDEIVFHSHLPSDNARVALEIIRGLDMSAVVLGNAFKEDVVWFAGDTERDARLTAYVERNRAVARPFGPETLEHDPVELIIMDSMERLEALDRALTGHQAPPPAEDPPAQDGPAGPVRLWRVIFSRNQFTAGGAIEVVGPDTSKAAALAHLCRRLDITPKQLIAFGDNVNDVEMLDYAGLGVAMGNATDDARAAAARIAPSNDEDGIAVTLEALGIA